MDKTETYEEWIKRVAGTLPLQHRMDAVERAVIRLETDRVAFSTIPDQGLLRMRYWVQRAIDKLIVDGPNTDLVKSFLQEALR